MAAYIIRRVLYAIPIVIGVNILVFMLFFYVNSPNQMAEAHLGSKRVNPDLIDKWKREHSLHLPYFFNEGWRRLGTLHAKRAQNKAAFDVVGPGRYRISVEAPQNIKVVKARRLALQTTKGYALDLPNTFSKEGAIALEPSVEKRTFVIGLKATKPNPAQPPRIEIVFDVQGLESPSPVDRVVVDYQDEIAFSKRFSNTIFFQRSLKMLWFEYGKSDRGFDISNEIWIRMGPSLSVTVPAFVLGILLNIFLPWSRPSIAGPTWIIGAWSCA